jgi:hypothetical protein
MGAHAQRLQHVESVMNAPHLDTFHDVIYREHSIFTRRRR